MLSPFYNIVYLVAAAAAAVVVVVVVVVVTKHTSALPVDRFIN
jgi:hypothetical protein